MTYRLNTPNSPKFPLPRTKIIARGLLGFVTLGCVAGEIGLQLQHHDGAWDALSAIKLAMPVIALAILLGKEHAGEELNRTQRLGMWLAIGLCIGTTMWSSVQRTAGALNVIISSDEITKQHHDQLLKQRDDKVAEGQRLRANAEAEGKNGGCKAACKSIEAQAKTAEDAAAGFEKEARATTYSPEAMALVSTATAFNIDPKNAQLYAPMMLPIALQLGVIFAGSAAFGPIRRRSIKPVGGPGLQLVASQPTPEPPKPGQRHTHQQAEADLLNLTAAGAVPVERDLAARWGWSHAHTQRLIADTEATGTIVKFRQGRRMAYAIA